MLLKSKIIKIRTIHRSHSYVINVLGLKYFQFIKAVSILENDTTFSPCFQWVTNNHILGITSKSIKCSFRIRWHIRTIRKKTSSRTSLCTLFFQLGQGTCIDSDRNMYIYFTITFCCIAGFSSWANINGF